MEGQGGRCVQGERAGLRVPGSLPAQAVPESAPWRRRSPPQPLTLPRPTGVGGGGSLRLGTHCPQVARQDPKALGTIDPSPLPPSKWACPLCPVLPEQSSPRARFPEMKRKKKLMMLPRCFLQPCWHSCSLSAAPWAGPGASPRPAIPRPDPRNPSHSAALVGSVPPLPASPQPGTQSLSSRTLSPTSGLSLSLRLSVPWSRWPAFCPPSSGPTSCLWTFPRTACPSAQPRAPRGWPVSCSPHWGLSPAPAPGPAFHPAPSVTPQDPGTHSPWRRNGSYSFLGWEGVRAGVGAAPELPAARGGGATGVIFS